MATFNVVGMEEAIKQMDFEAERVKRRGPAAVQAGGEVAKNAMRQTVPVRTGQLSEAIQVGKVEHTTADGIHCDVFPDGRRADGERFAEIGFVLEYGREGMPARPWMRPAVERESAAITEAVANVLMGD